MHRAGSPSAASTGRSAVSKACTSASLLADDPDDLALEPQQPHAVAARWRREPVVEAHPCGTTNTETLARRRRVVDVRGGRERGERAVARADERELAHLRRAARGSRVPCSLEPVGHARGSPLHTFAGSGCREKHFSWSRARSHATNGA